ncbi:MAG: AEC family transporter [Hyphomicrobiales bacterium]
MAAALSLLPVFLTIAAGFLARRTSLVREHDWAGVDRLAYYVLFPAILIKEIATASFGEVPVARMAFAMVLAVIALAALLIVLKRPAMQALGMNDRQFTSYFQGATRWHTFIALAVLPLTLGKGALALAAVSMAAMIPLLNVLTIVVMTVYLGGKLDPVAISKAIAKNPFVIGTVLGVLILALGITLPRAIVDLLDIVGRGALGIALLSVGAGLRLDQLRSTGVPVLATTALKLVAMPASMLLFTTLLGVTGLPQAVAVICGAVPTGSGGYILAREMGGDAPMFAAILTLQVVLSAATLPMWVALLTG